MTSYERDQHVTSTISIRNSARQDAEPERPFHHAEEGRCRR